jgi:hypothetical protein
MIELSTSRPPIGIGCFISMHSGVTMDEEYCLVDSCENFLREDEVPGSNPANCSRPRERIVKPRTMRTASENIWPDSIWIGRLARVSAPPGQRTSKTVFRKRPACLYSVTELLPEKVPPCF